MKLIENNVPTKDIIFQLLFGRNKNKHLTDHFIKSTFKYINEDTNLNNDFLKWLKFLEYEDMEVIQRMAKENKFIEDAQNEIFVLTAEQEEKNWQRFRENYLIDRKFDRAEFFRDGRKEGFKEAILDFAKKMLAEKYSIQEIINLTGLSEKEINKLAKTI